jgi:hypothetical protein
MRLRETRETAAKVNASVPAMPKSIVDSNFVRTIAAARPTAVPIPASFMLSPTIKSRTLRR